MKVYRYMSLKEFSKMSAGCDIVGKVFHAAHTTGHGVFFLPETCGYAPERFLDFLSGIVTSDVMVEFEVNCPYDDSYGTYADPDNWDWYSTITVHEVCVEKYNRDEMIPVRYYIPDDYFGNHGTWYPFN